MDEQRARDETARRRDDETGETWRVRARDPVMPDPSGPHHRVVLERGWAPACGCVHATVGPRVAAEPGSYPMIASHDAPGTSSCASRPARPSRPSLR